MANRQAVPGGWAAEKAERLRKSAENWDRGAEGERLTAEALAPLAGRGYRIFHDLKIPRSRANIDHLVIGPTGVFAIDSKNLTTKLHIYNGDVWRGRYPYAGKLKATRWEADAAAEALGHPAAVTAVQCIHGADIPDLDGPLHGVYLIPAARLRSLITSAPSVFTDDQCTVLAAQAVLSFAGGERGPVQLAPAPAPAPPAPVPPTRVVVVAAEPASGLFERVRRFWRA